MADKSDKHNIIPGEALKVDSIYLPLNHLFSPHTKKAFEFESEHTIAERDIEVMTTTQSKALDQCKYFGAVATSERRIYDAAQKVAEIVNEYSKQGFVTGCLKGSKLILLPMAAEPFQIRRYIVICYAMLSPEGLEYYNRNKDKRQVEMGGLPLEEI